MHASVIKIGNSRGIRIPKSLLAACGIEDAVELTVEAGKIVLSAPSRLRLGWLEAAQEMAANGDDVLIDPPVETAFDRDEWEW